MGNMRFKVGDRVRIKSLDWYNENKDELGNMDCGNALMITEKSKFCGKIVTISNVSDVIEVYKIEEDNGCYNWTDEMIEGLVEEEVGLVDNLSSRWVNEFNLPEGYIFKDENGNVINATKIVLEKKKKEYPKTYEKCCKVLDIEDRELVFNGEYRASKLYWKQLGRLNILNKLLICRDAYWKIAGEEMGLDEPWEPDYSGTFEHGTPIKYVIYNIGTHIVKERKSSPNHILSFPTEEMAYAFYENFKEEIEQCKELL